MTRRTHKLIATTLLAVTVFGGFEALGTLSNLNQLDLFSAVAWAVYAFLVFDILFFYDLHYRDRAVPLGHLFKRFSHFFEPDQVIQALNYLLLPSFLYWATVGILFLHQGHERIQQGFIWLSSIAMVSLYWHVREILSRKRERVDPELFVAMSVLKILTVGLIYTVGLALLRRYCIEPWLYAAGVFSATLLLVDQALFQHRLLDRKTLAVAVAIAAVQAALAYLAYRYWGLNFYTAGIALTATYNVMWGVFHHRLDGNLTKRVFFEILILSLIVAGMVFSVTNFRAQLIDSCF